MAILMSGEVITEVDRAGAEDRTISRDAAQTIASWWYSPRQTAMVEFVTCDRVTPELVSELEAERDAFVTRGPQQEGYINNLKDLDALLRWIREQ